MCGRTALYSTIDDLVSYTGASRPVRSGRYRPSYNVAPTRYQPILMNYERIDSGVDSEPQISSKNKRSRNISERPNSAKKRKGETQTKTDTKKKTIASSKEPSTDRLLVLMKWGLQIGKKITVFNIRDDSLLSSNPSPCFHRYKHKHRCLIVVNGYYEWKEAADKIKIPYFFRPKKDSDFLLLAGCYGLSEKKPSESETSKGQDPSSKKKGKSGEKNVNLDEEKDQDFPEYEYAIVTVTPPNQEIFSIHKRMPLVLFTEKEINLWLDTTQTWDDVMDAFLNERSRLSATNKTWKKNVSEKMIFYPVNKDVGNIRLNDPDFVKEDPSMRETEMKIKESPKKAETTLKQYYKKSEKKKKASL